MARLTLNPAPTFKAPVSIPVPGGESDPVVFEFRHRTRAEALAWGELAADRSDVELVLDMAVGWDLDDPFTPENVARLCDNYLGAGVAIYRAYLTELRGARAKN